MTTTPLTIACSFDPRQRRRPGRKQLQESAASPPPAVSSGRVPRIARLLALAIRCEQLLQTGVIANYAELAADWGEQRKRWQALLGNREPRMPQ
jgi:hypothetical protein